MRNSITSGLGGGSGIGAFLFSKLITVEDLQYISLLGGIVLMCFSVASIMHHWNDKND